MSSNTLIKVLLCSDPQMATLVGNYNNIITI